MVMNPDTSALPDDGYIRAILADRIDVQRRGVGMVVGVIDAQGRRIVAHGEMRRGDGRVPDADAVFEIGSITKAFTSLVLADMVTRGEVALDDPVDAYLPTGVTAPGRDGRRITLIDLATHTSGLPRADPAFGPFDTRERFANYSVDDLYRFLGAYRLGREIGARFEYSNLGAGLLGHVLALRDGADFEGLIRRRITGPLSMASTAIAPPVSEARLAMGHGEDLLPVAPFGNPTLAGAGSLCSTARDLLTFLAAELGFAEPPLKAAMTAQLAPRRPSLALGNQIALGWRVSATPVGEVVWHAGGTFGQLSFLGFDLARRIGVVVLTNCAASTDRDNIGFHLLGAAPLWSARQPITVAAETLAPYVGRYRLTPRTALAITRDGDRLFAQMLVEGLKRPRPVFEIYPESPTRFFWKVVGGDVTFETDADGRADSLTMRQASGETRGRRMPGS
jgi:D-alanyl-D-alanine-carboxypeptidase/D-alanyl-D-alanine-endopeptidase